MKYLVTEVPRAPSRPLSQEQVLALNKAARESIEESIADGTLDSVYAFPDGGALAIVNAESHEELWDILMEYPLYHYMDWEIKVLCNWSHGIDRLVERLQKQAD